MGDAELDHTACFCAARELPLWRLLFQALLEVRVFPRVPAALSFWLRSGVLSPCLPYLDSTSSFVFPVPTAFCPHPLLQELLFCMCSGQHGNF